MSPPILSWITRSSKKGGPGSDNFNRVGSSLGVTSTGGLLWLPLRGTWSTNGTRAVVSDAISTNPLAVVDPGLGGNVAASLTVGTADALYFRVVDADNWWRVRHYGYQTSSNYSCNCQTCCQTCCSSCTGAQKACWERVCESACGSNASIGTKTCSCNCAATGNGECNNWSCTYSCNCASCNCVSCNCQTCTSYDDNYRVYLEKCIAGAITTVTTYGTYSSPFSSLRVDAKDDDIRVWATRSGTEYSVYAAPAAQSDHQNGRLVGIGRGGSNYNSSNLDNFVVGLAA